MTKAVLNRCIIFNSNIISIHFQSKLIKIKIQLKSKKIVHPKTIIQKNQSKMLITKL